MSNAYLCPILQQNQFTDNDTFLVGGQIWFYLAGSTTPATAYTTEAADVAWSNPIILNQRGEAGGEIWLASGISYKIILEEKPYDGNEHGVVVSTFDNVTGVNDVVQSSGATNWIIYPGTPTRIDATTFSVSGDATATFQKYRRIKSINGIGPLYSTIKSSTYASGTTTVVVVNDTTGFDTDFSQVLYSFVETNPSSIPKAVLTGSASTSSSHQIFIDYLTSKLNYSVDSGASSSVWPIDVNGDNGDFATSLQVAGADVWTNTNNTATLSASGRASFKNGLQVRWGSFTGTPGGAAVTFSTAFSTGAFAVTISDTNNKTEVTALSASGFTATNASSGTGYYIAVGH